MQALGEFTVCKHCNARDCGFARVLFRFVNFSFCTTAVVRCAATRWFLLAARGWRDQLLAAEQALLCNTLGGYERLLGWIAGSGSVCIISITLL